MSEECVFEFTGYITELVIAPVPTDKAEHWLKRSKDDLITHAYDSQEEEGYHNIEAGFLPAAKFMEGCELRKGFLTITNDDGEELKSCSLDSDEFADEVDDVQTINPATHLVDDGPTLVRLTRMSGEITYKPGNPVHLDYDDDGDKNWYVFVNDAGNGQFVSNLFVDGEEVKPETGGSYESQEVWLNVPDGSGGLRQLHHRVEPQSRNRVCEN